jgi:DNA-binding transcriptional LysR family regulator
MRDDGLAWSGHADGSDRPHSEGNGSLKGGEGQELDDFRQLRQLVALDEHRSMASAAETLGVTKSALSQSLKRLEDLYGVSLFHRGRRGIEPTAYGKRLIDAARRGLSLFEQTRREVELLKNFEMGWLIIACDPTLTEVLLGPTLTEISVRYPRLQFTLKSGFWEDFKAALHDGQIDIYVGLRPDEPITEFNVAELHIPAIVLYARTDHPLAKANCSDIRQILSYPRIGPRVPDWFFDMMMNSSIGAENEKSRIYGSHDITLLTNDGGMSRSIVKHSDSICGSFRSVLAEDVAAGKLAILPISSPPFSMKLPGVIVTRKDYLLPPSASEVVETLSEIADRLVRLDEGLIA